MKRSNRPPPPEKLASRERVCELLDYDSDTGLVKNRVQRINSLKVGEICGRRQRDGHLAYHIDGRSYLLHRLVWFIVYGVWPIEVDHINGDPADNRLVNLREATRQQNAQNTAVRRDNRTGIKGVWIGPRPVGPPKFYARLTENGRTRKDGPYNTAEEAGAVYAAHAARVHGEFASNRLSRNQNIPLA